MIKVDKKQFFDVVGPLDVHPSMQNDNFTDWKTRGGVVVGRSIPGWKNYYTNGKPIEKQYFLNDTNRGQQ
jgi:hypothetical protein